MRGPSGDTAFMQNLPFSEMPPPIYTKLHFFGNVILNLYKTFLFSEMFFSIHAKPALIVPRELGSRYFFHYSSAMRDGLREEAGCRVSERAFSGTSNANCGEPVTAGRWARCAQGGGGNVTEVGAAT